MNNIQMQCLEWGKDFLESKGYSIQHAPQMLLSTPWSTVFLFPTSSGNIYLKETAPPLSLESHVFKVLTEKFNANVPAVIAINDSLHCFLTLDDGKPLRESLKAEFRPDLLCNAIKEFSKLQRATENFNEMFIKLGVPDWRLDKLPNLYDQMINKTHFLSEEGITESELQALQELSPKFSLECKLLSNYGIPETLGFHDFHDNNILIDPDAQKMTFIDFAETAIIHPFFSLFTCLWQSIKHHGVKEGDPIYQKLQEACFENWLGLMTKDKLLEVFVLIKKLWSIYSALDCFRVMMSVDLKTYRSYYANRPSLIAKYLREFMLTYKQYF